MSLNTFKVSSLKLFLLNKSPLFFSFRYARNRHRNVQFAIINNYQPWPKPLNISQLLESIESNDPSELRDQFRRKGLLPMNHFLDKPINTTCSTTAFDSYIPPEGDGKSSLLSFEKVKETGKYTQSALTNLKDTRKIRKYEPDFSRSKFAYKGEEIYREVLNLLPNHQKNYHRLLELVTEHGLSEMLSGLNNRSVMIDFRRHIEPPAVMKVLVTEGTNEGQLFGQVTLRIFSEQMIAIYDRFGRLIYGSDSMPMDLLEYVVFEKQVTEEYSSWRIHTKISPDWMSKKFVYHRTERLDVSDNLSDQDSATTTSSLEQ